MNMPLDDPARGSEVKDVLKACDPQNGEYPYAPALAAGLSMIAIGLIAVDRELDRLVSAEARIPREMEAVANSLFTRGAMAFSTLHRLAMVPE